MGTPIGAEEEKKKKYPVRPRPRPWWRYLVARARGGRVRLLAEELHLVPEGTETVREIDVAPLEEGAGGAGGDNSAAAAATTAEAGTQAMSKRWTRAGRGGNSFLPNDHRTT